MELLLQHQLLDLEKLQTLYSNVQAGSMMSILQNYYTNFIQLSLIQVD